MRLFTLTLALLSSTAAFAHKRDVINPIGEENLGFLEIKEPKWGTPEEAHIYPYTLSYRGVTVNPGVKLRIVEGDGCLTLKSSQTTNDHQLCGIKVEAKKTTTVELSGLVVTYDPKDKLSVDFGRRASLTVKREGNVFAHGTAEAFNGAAKRGLVVLPGKYDFSFNVGSLPEQAHTIAAGKVYHLDLTPPETRVTIRVKAPQRVYPDVPVSPCTVPGRSFLIHRSKIVNSGFLEGHPYDVLKGYYNYHPGLGILSYKNFNLAQDSEFRAFPIGKDEAPQNYQYVVNNQLHPISAEKPQETVVIVVKRIDVNDVLVTNEQGQQQYVKGTYTIERRDEAGKWVPQVLYQSRYSDCSGDVQTAKTSFPTKTGMDVLPGYYRVVVTYNTAEGAKTAQYEADLR